MAEPVRSISGAFYYFRSGRRRIFMKEIEDRTGIDVTSLHPYLDNLINLPGIVSCQVPAGEEKDRSRPGRYFLSGPFFQFYARFVYPHLSAFEAGSYSSYIKTIHEQWNSHAGKCFRDQVREMLTENLQNDYYSIGSWWNRKRVDIVIVAMSPGKSLVIECTL